MIVVHQLIKDH